MRELPSWMRTALYATAVMNLVAAVALLTPAGRAAAGVPEGPIVYIANIALFVALFGAGYLRAAIAGRDERLFLWVAAAGKLGFAALVIALWLSGELPLRAPVAASGDIAFGLLFLRHLTSR